MRLNCTVNKIFSLLLFVVICNPVNGQVPTPNKPLPALIQVPSPASAPDANILAGYNGSVNINYVRTKDAVAPIASVTDFDAADYTKVKQATQYLDGLGRPHQTVIRQISTETNPKDQVLPIKYDNYGREIYKYLPYVQSANNASDNDGGYKTAPFTQLSNFYNNVYKDANQNLMYKGEQFLFGKIDYEPSPINRIDKTMAAGNSWHGKGKGISQQYLLNVSADEVRIWNIGFDPLMFNTTNQDANINVPNSPGTYNVTNGSNKSVIYKNVTIDEHDNAIVEYKDKDGHLLLKKVQAGTINSDFSGYDGWLCTYYVYDDLGQLRFVMPPKAVEYIRSNSWSFPSPSSNTNTITTINELCFRYEYDRRQRMSAKKTPGAGWVYMVYDLRDRLVFTQDANQRQNYQWMATLYDMLNRTVMTGILASSQSRDDLQQLQDQQTSGANSSISATGSGVPNRAGQLIIPRYDANHQPYQATESITFLEGFESPTGADFTAEIITSPSASSFNNSVNVSLNPLPGSANFTPLTITYYDTYNSVSGNSYTDSYNNKLEIGTNAYPEDVVTTPAQQLVRTSGLVTATRVRILENPANLSAGKWLTTVNYYDDKGRLLQVKSDNYKGGNDVTTNRYDFAGKIISSYLFHTNPQNTYDILRIATLINYDHAGRLLKIYKTVNDDASKQALIASNTYDELGQLKTKQLGRERDVNGNYSNTAIETLDYNYNIRGWLKGINTAYSHPELLSTNAPQRWFGFELNYDWGSANSMDQYNGNIASSTWKSRGDETRRAYGYSYDKVNRIVGADFSENNSGAYAHNSDMDFSMLIGDGTGAASTYDANGNIKKMIQYGRKQLSSSIIDQLTYNYFSNTNKLSSVEEPGQTIEDNKLGDFTDNNKGTDDYGYDKSGNLITDKNKRINGSAGLDLVNGGAIIYNHLNLPYKVIVKNSDGSEKGNIFFIYDASGRKLEKRVRENASNVNPGKDVNTTYVGGIVYEQDAVQYIIHEEGRLRFVNSTQSSCSVQPQSGQFVYDYFVKDHLGSTRMVLTDQQDKQCYLPATVESGNINQEKNFFNINDAQVETLSESFKQSYPSMQDKAYRVTNVNGERTGLGIVLKVMSGDKVSFKAESYYTSTQGGSAGQTAAVTLSQLLGAFVGSGMLSATKPGIGLNELTSSSTIANALNSFLSDPGRNVAATIPRATLNYILFDEQLKKVAGGFDPVNPSGGYKNHDTYVNNPVVVGKSGYLYIYVSNESDLKVLFDNLLVTHTRGPLVEETHYYPFGLTMAGISSKAIKSNYSENRNKYNGIELTEDLDVATYDAFYRQLDPQTGRWLEIDPKIESMEAWSPYASNYDNPIKYSDPLGNVGGSCCQVLWDNLKSFVNDKIDNFKNNTAAEVDWVTTKVSEGVSQAKENFQNRWEAGVTLPQDFVRNPLQYIDGVGEIKMGMAALGIMSEKAVVKETVVAYEVGTYKDLVNRSIKGDMLDVHHAVQKQPASQIVPGYNADLAPAIVLPKPEHTAIKPLKGTNTAGNGTARDQLAKDIRDLRNNTNAPNSSLQQLIDMNKQTYEIFRKGYKP